jgi:hypothetical protein
MKDFINAYFYNLANLVSLYTAAAIFTLLRLFKVGGFE